MFDVIIIGSGPAGLTAAIYTTRANLKTLLVAGVVWGGQLQLTTLVENYPGFPEGIQGPDLMMAMRKQAEKFKPTIIDDNLKSVDFSSSPFKVQVADKTYEGKSVIIATGADSKKIGVPGEKEFAGKGVSYCATCDGAFFKDKDLIVVGGGDTAMEDSNFLTHFAKSVTIVHRRDEFRASKIMLDRTKANPKINFFLNAVVEEIMGDQKVSSIRVKVMPSDKSLLSKSPEEIEKITPALFSPKFVSKDEKSITLDLKTDGVFVAIGHVPNSFVFKGIDADDRGYIKVQEHSKTNVDGVFVAGDVHDSHYRQAVTAAGFGCAAALEVERWLSSQKA